MKILYAASEAVPFCKTGGLADVAGSLPPALAEQGAETAVILPLYRRVREKFADQLTFLCYDYVDLAWRHTYCGLFSMKKDGVTWYFLDNEQYFDRPELYGYVDDGERFGFFSRAVVKMLDHLEFWPDVIHCNDWQTALIPIYLKDDGVREDRYRSIRTVLTIHNIEYQGRYDPYCLGDLFGLDRGWVDDGTLLLDGDLNLLKGAILTADAVNAVSPTYAQELKNPYFAHRMEGILTQCGYKLSGVLNGIDMKLYDPAADGRITANYTAEDLSGKAADKTALQNLMSLNEEPNTPIIAMVSRLVSHKGLDLLREVMGDIMELPAQFVVLGSGDAGYEEFFRRTAERYPGRMAVRLGYNEALSMAIYAGADLFLMPSRSEPCGLSQMISMRYAIYSKLRIISILHPPALIFLIFLYVHTFLYESLVQFVQQIEFTSQIHHRTGFPLLVYHEQRRNTCRTCHKSIVCTECRSDMYDTRTIFGSYIVTGNNAECLTGRFLPFPVFIHCHRFHPRNKLFVFHAYQIRSFIFTHYFERNQFVTRLIVFQRQFFRFLVKVSIKQSFRQHYGHLFPSISVVSLHSHIVYFRSYAQCRIRRQCPRSSGPCQEIRRSPFRHFGFRILHLELSYHSGVFHITVTARLVQLVRAQSCSGSRRVRLDGVAFI